MPPLEKKIVLCKYNELKTIRKLLKVSLNISTQ